MPGRLGPLLIASLLVPALACEDPRRRRGGGGDDDTADDDTADDDAADDDTGDDDAGDDDTDPSAPQIVEVEVCQVTFSSNSFALFNIDVIDPDDDLPKPVSYRVQIDLGPLTTHQYDHETWEGGSSGTIAHTQQIGQATLPRGSTHDFQFAVLDAVGHVSAPMVVAWTIPATPEADLCG